MNKDELGGKLENLKGRTKEAAGALAGNEEKEAEGVVERVAGAVRENVGKAKEREAGAPSPPPSRKIGQRRISETHGKLGRTAGSGNRARRRVFRQEPGSRMSALNTGGRANRGQNA